jgi:hypothetical protein
MDESASHASGTGPVTRAAISNSGDIAAGCRLNSKVLIGGSLQYRFGIRRPA